MIVILCHTTLHLMHHPNHLVLASSAVLVTPNGTAHIAHQIAVACQEHPRQSSSVLPKHCVLVSGAVGHARWQVARTRPDCMPKASETVIICPSQALCAGFRCSLGHARWQVARTRLDCMPKASETVIICPSQALCAGFRCSLGHARWQVASTRPGGGSGRCAEEVRHQEVGALQGGQLQQCCCPLDSTGRTHEDN